MNQNRNISHPTHGASVVEILERVLDKGVVIAGDISISLVDIELLTIKVRLVVASVEKAQEMGIDWWQNDPQLSSLVADTPSKEVESKSEIETGNETSKEELEARIAKLESQLLTEESEEE